MEIEVSVDVLRLILEAATSLERRSYENYPAIARLMLLSKQIYAWLEPLLYRELLLTASNVEALSKVLDGKSPQFIETHVKTLIIYYIDRELDSEPSAASRNILNKCLQVERIELYDCSLPSYFLRSHHRPTSLQLAIEDLSTLGSVIPQNLFKLDLFQNVTHLEFTSMLKSHGEYPTPFAAYGRAPSLTHLAFDESGLDLDDFVVPESVEYYPKTITELLQACSKLEMLVLLTNMRENDLTMFASTFGALKTGRFFVLLDSWGVGGYNVSGGVWSAATKVDLGEEELSVTG